MTTTSVSFSFGGVHFLLTLWVCISGICSTKSVEHAIRDTEVSSLHRQRPELGLGKVERSSVNLDQMKRKDREQGKGRSQHRTTRTQHERLRRRKLDSVIDPDDRLTPEQRKQKRLGKVLIRITSHKFYISCHNIAYHDLKSIHGIYMINIWSALLHKSSTSVVVERTW